MMLMNREDKDEFHCVPVLLEQEVNGVRREVQRVYWRVRKRYKDLKIISNAQPNQVCEAFDEVSGHKVAIKLAKCAFVDENHARKYCRELFLLPRLDHPNVIRILDAFSNVELDSRPDYMNELYLVLSLTDWDLNQYLCHLLTQTTSQSKRNSTHPIQTEDQLERNAVKSIMFQILSGLNYLHSNGLMHRDLNPSNVGLTFDGQVFLLDFDFSRHVNNRNKEGHSIFISNQNYRAPEIVLTPGLYEKKVDIWSAGCIFAELLAIYNGLRSSRLSAKQFLQLPEGAGPIQYFQELLKLVGPPPESFFDCCLTDGKESFKICINDMIREHQLEPEFDSRFSFLDSPAKELLKSLVAFDPKERISANQALKHKYFQEFHLQEETSDASSLLSSNSAVNEPSTSHSDANNNNNEDLVCPVDVMDKPTTMMEIKHLVFAELHNFPTSR
ncbi:mitogen-activated protein kinase 14A-like [Symsagittifera roscoffensis]|uniref:mitogen-activated protein kinase 14A-like n=1 Tax=Symsagittifera roscoffensis TaxID=84072 RepID=UPI00307C5E6C